MIPVIAQGFGVLGMAGNILSYQQKKQRGIILFQLVASIFWIIHYVLLGIAANTFYIACLLNGAGVLRALVFSNKEKFKAEKLGWLVFFVCLYVASYALTFTVFGKQPLLSNFAIELLPLIAMTANTVGFRMKTARATRLANLVNSPCWLLYSVFSFSLPGILGETMTITSTLIGFLRYDRKKSSPDKK